MNSIPKSSDPKQSLKSKAKAVATKYQKYCLKKQSQKVKGRGACIIHCIEKVDAVMRNGWNTLMPKLMRGPVTPYQQLMMHISQTKCKVQLQTLPFSRISIEQITQKHRIKVILTYTTPKLQQTLHKIHNNQQINTLLNKKAQIIPICIMETNTNKLSYTLKQLIDKQGSGIAYEEHVFVLWKGLFQELIVIGHFQLGDAELCYRVFQAVQEREDYEELVKGIVEGNGDMMEQSSLNKLEESTGVDKDNDG